MSVQQTLRLLDVRRLDAPKTMDSMFGCEATYSMASSGGMAPEARTDIAIARNAALAQRALVGLDAAAHAEADLVDVRADDRVLDPEPLEHVDAAAAGSS